MNLEEGECICPKCNGGGSWPVEYLKEENPRYNRCPRCWGTGKLDWIEMIVGKKEFESYRVIDMDITSLYPVNNMSIVITS